MKTVVKSFQGLSSTKARLARAGLSKRRVAPRRRQSVRAPTARNELKSIQFNYQEFSVLLDAVCSLRYEKAKLLVALSKPVSISQKSREVCADLTREIELLDAWHFQLGGRL